MADFPLARHLVREHGFPMLDWGAAQAWVDAIPLASDRPDAWGRLEGAWLEHLRTTLGEPHRLEASAGTWLLSALPPREAQATIAHVARTRQRILRLLDGIAQPPRWGKDILIVFEDEAAYYAYVAQFYPDAGEFAASSGMFISAGCGHFVTVRADLRTVEPVIVHELVHSCVSHLPLPVWLNEGLAVGIEQRLSPAGPAAFSPQEMHAKHQAFWTAADVQAFWSGQSFARADDANLLSYDLARILVAQLSKDWPAFRQFVLEADALDAGARAAATHLQLDLGMAVAAILDRPAAAELSPRPAGWPLGPTGGRVDRPEVDSLAA